MDRASHRGQGDGKRQPPVHIPLPFEKAVEGLLGVKPQKSSEAQSEQRDQGQRRRAKKKPGRKKK